MHNMQNGTLIRALLLISAAFCLAPTSAMAQAHTAKDAITAIQPLDTRVTSIRPTGSGDDPDDTVARPSPVTASKWGPSLPEKTHGPGQQINPSNSQLPQDGNLPPQTEDSNTLSAGTKDINALPGVAKDINALSAGTEKLSLTEIGKSSPDGTDNSDSSGVDDSDISKATANLRFAETVGVSNPVQKPLSPGTIDLETLLKPATAAPEAGNGLQYGKASIHSPFSEVKPLSTFSRTNHSKFYQSFTDDRKAKEKQAKLKQKRGSSALFSNVSNTIQSDKSSKTLNKQSGLQKNGLTENGDLPPQTPDLQ